jgi:hypothetical protein
MADEPTFIPYTGNGSTTDFVFPFDYISSDHIQVTVAGVVTTYQLISQNTVRISPAPAGGTAIRISRVTPSDPLVVWSDGDIMLGANLNRSVEQPIYVAQEARDISDEAKEIAAEAKQTAETNISDALVAVAQAQAAAVDALASKTEAAASQTGAASSATTATNAAGTATTKASEAAASATTADNRATSATSSANTATTKASEASASTATATTKAAEATTAAATATTKAAEASVSASQAATSATAIENAQTLVESIYDSFDDRYLGLKSTDPTVDNDGNPLQIGTICFNTTMQALRIYTASGWQSAYIPSDNAVSSFNGRTGAVSPVAGDYAVAGITGLQTALDGKAAASHTHTIANVTNLQTTLDGKAASSHAHAIADVTDLQTSLDGKSATSHTHTIANVTSLQTTLDGKEALGLVRAVSAKTANYTAVLADAGQVVEMNVAAANTFTIPPNSSVAFPIRTYINLAQLGAGQTTITAGAGVTIRSRNGLKLAGQYAVATLYKRGTDEWVVGGDVAV